MSEGQGPKPVGAIVEHLFRRKAGQMVSTLTRIFGPANLDLAEEVVQEALLSALQQWPYHGVPANPSAWLVQVAKNRALDRLRRETVLRKKTDALGLVEAQVSESLEAIRFEPEVSDDQLGMIFLSCHPAIPRPSRVALTLKTVAGLGIDEIARAYLTQRPTVQQRIVRAKREIKERGLPFELPAPAELGERLESVLEVLYLIFNNGYAAVAGENLVRAELCDEAIRLAELILARPELAQPKVHALLALFYLQSARAPARVDASGEILLLHEQDRSRWDRRRLHLGLAHFERALEGEEETSYHLQAAIATCHALAPSAAETPWARIVSLYDRLLVLTPSPVIALNRAVALAMTEGPRAGLEALEVIGDHPAMRLYYLYPAAKAELWSRLGAWAQAAACYRQALALPASGPEQRFLRNKLAEAEAKGAG